jgi:hypothetical protein
MKALFTIFMIIVSTFVWAGETSAPIHPESAVVKGDVLEVINVENFTYLRLNTPGGEIWTAVINAPVKKGDVVTIKDAIVMNNFESKILKRTFPTILFGTLVGSGGSARVPLVMGTSYLALAQKWNTGGIHVPRASGADARTVAEIVTKAGELAGKSVVLRGKVVKYNADIMGKNWIHLRDGSGSASDNTNDILVTSANQVKPGDVVTFRGVVRTGQNFGAGYAYKVLIEEATLQ